MVERSGALIGLIAALDDLADGGNWHDRFFVGE